MSPSGNIPPRVVHGDKCVLALEQFKDGDARRVGFSLYLELPPSLLVHNATYQMPHAEIQAVLRHLKDGVGSGRKNLKGHITITSVSDNFVGLKVSLETLVAKTPSTQERWTYSGDGTYVVTAMPEGR